MAQGSITDEELAALIRRTEEANAAFMRGDMRRYATLITHSDDYTLMAPYGGAPTRGFDDPASAWPSLRATSGPARLSWTWCNPTSRATWWFL